MRRLFPGTITVHIVQHAAGLQEINELETSLLSHKREELVLEWTQRGMYGDAKVFRHREILVQEPSIPSRRLGAELALEENPDFHLWLEDDAIVCDENCHRWAELMSKASLGVYRCHPEGYVNSAYFLSTRSFDICLLEELKNYSRWTLSGSLYTITKGLKRVNPDIPRIEAAISRLAKKPWAYFSPAYAVRYHSTKRGSLKSLQRFIFRLCPNELPLLSIDFPAELR